MGRYLLARSRGGDVYAGLFDHARRTSCGGQGLQQARIFGDFDDGRWHRRFYPCIQIQQRRKRCFDLFRVSVHRGRAVMGVHQRVSQLAGHIGKFGRTIGGVLIIVSASFGSSRLTGDFLALFMTLMMSGTMVVYRKFPLTTAALPAALSSVVLLPFSLSFGDPFAVQTHELLTLIAFGLFFAVASVTLSEGARRLPSAETALLSTLEMPLAPVLAFLVLAEVPTSSTIVGGTIIFLAVVWSQKRKGGH